MDGLRSYQLVVIVERTAVQMLDESRKGRPWVMQSPPSRCPAKLGLTAKIPAESPRAGPSQLSVLGQPVGGWPHAWVTQPSRWGQQ